MKSRGARAAWRGISAGAGGNARARLRRDMGYNIARNCIMFLLIKNASPVCIPNSPVPIACVLLFDCY